MDPPTLLDSLYTRLDVPVETTWIEMNVEIAVIAWRIAFSVINSLFRLIPRARKNDKRSDLILSLLTPGTIVSSVRKVQIVVLATMIGADACGIPSNLG
jgi:hypothetical protein